MTISHILIFLPFIPLSTPHFAFLMPLNLFSSHICMAMHGHIKSIPRSRLFHIYVSPFIAMPISLGIPTKIFLSLPVKPNQLPNLSSYIFTPSCNSQPSVPMNETHTHHTHLQALISKFSHTHLARQPHPYLMHPHHPYTHWNYFRPILSWPRMAMQGSIPSLFISPYLSNP